nr:transmembrane protein 265 isoform X2 [Geotrypetes seraphini]XP_033802913.1 transmembrane protein 265 isoform X2 [Geotrypetes seraphini]XP_033802914.1 transmembrane protein 265 isoform X2 [Geotrypetes seraphini]
MAEIGNGHLKAHLEERLLQEAPITHETITIERIPEEHLTQVVTKANRLNEIPEFASATKKSHKLRHLAIASIICGYSCIGIAALFNAMKAVEKEKVNRVVAEPFRRKSIKLSIISILLWLTTLILVPLFIYFLSYILAVAE